MSVTRAAGRIMRAIRVAEFGSPEVMKLQNGVAIPEPSSKEVLIKIKAAGVNPVETYIRSGNRNVLPALPYTPGTDGSGVVEKIGSKVTKFKPGDRVYTKNISSGSYAEFGIAAESKVDILPENMTFQQGAAVGIPYYTAYRSLFQRGKARASETVLIHGASGAVGIACLQLGSAYGLNLMGTAGTPKGLELIAKHGAEKVFNHREEDYTKQIMEATAGKGVDLIIEMLANVNLDKDLDLLAPHGRVVVVGNRGPTQIDARKTMGKETCIVGVMLTNIDDYEYKEIAAAVGAGMAKGFLNPVVGLEYPLEEAVEAHREVIDHKQGTHGKIVLNV
ncbi:quinone oxidoreductase-like [Ptychodera flava]|uniref:quinone oxidoreductase-like n=1 Tax=Ptychodera flava TaxID=63121 RepID=UPI00396A5423